jgi:hypothetical protein
MTTTTDAPRTIAGLPRNERLKNRGGCRPPPVIDIAAFSACRISRTAAVIDAQDQLWDLWSENFQQSRIGLGPASTVKAADLQIG